MTRPGLTTAIAFSLSVLTGCATVAGPTQTGSAAVIHDPNAQLIGSAAAGQSFIAQGHGVLANSGSETITVIKQYPSASGKICKKFTVSNAPDAVRVACQNSDGSWKIYRSLAGVKQPSYPTLGLNTNDGAVTPASLQASTSSLASGNTLNAVKPVAASSAYVLSGETLWKFSKRVTGRGDNWRRIAAFNNIEEPNRIRAGYEIRIPENLISGS